MDIDICREYGQVGKLFFRFIKAKICRWLYVAYMYFGCIRFSMSVPPHPFVFTGCGSAGWQGRWKTGHCSSFSTLCPLSSAAPQYSLSDLHTLPLCANVQWTDFVRSQYSSKSMLLAEVKKNYLKLDAREEMCSASISIAHPHTQWVFFWDRPGWLLPNFVLVLPCAAHSSEWWWGRRGQLLEYQFGIWGRWHGWWRYVIIDAIYICLYIHFIKQKLWGNKHPWISVTLCLG